MGHIHQQQTTTKNVSLVSNLRFFYQNLPIFSIRQPSNNAQFLGCFDGTLWSFEFILDLPGDPGATRQLPWQPAANKHQRIHGNEEISIRHYIYILHYGTCVYTGHIHTINTYTYKHVCLDNSASKYIYITFTCQL